MEKNYNIKINGNYNGNRNYQSGNNYNDGKKISDYGKKVEVKNVKLKFNDKEEITDDKGTNYVDIAKDVIISICEDDKKSGEKKCKMSTSQIRNILGFLAVIFQKVQNNNYDELLTDMNLLKIKLLYTEGRNKNDNKKVYCSTFIRKGNLVELISFIDNKKKFINYYHYIEALVAWHKYYGGEE